MDQPTATVARRYLLDWLACALAGTATEPGQMLIAEGAARGGGPCTVLGLAERRDMEVAAFVNGGLSHIVEMDDLHRASVLHPGAVVIPAALAVAESIGATGREALTAVVIGYEAAIRIGEAIGGWHYRLWHTTATCGGFGAAAAAGHLLGLDEEQLGWAFGNVGSIAGGLWQFNQDGAMTKHLHTGRAAANGVQAASLASRGFTGAQAILEGTQGIFAAMARDAAPERVSEGLDAGLGSAVTPWRIGQVSIKPHASCRHTHPAVDAALLLRQRLGAFDPAEVAAVAVETYGSALAVTDNPAPVSAYQAQFSMQYTVARALLRGRVGLGDFGQQDRAASDVRALMAKVTPRVDGALDARYPRLWSARVRLTLTDGTEHTEEVSAPKGDPENPITDEELAAKARDLLAVSAFSQRTNIIIDAVQSFDDRPSVVGFLPTPD